MKVLSPYFELTIFRGTFQSTAILLCIVLKKQSFKHFISLFIRYMSLLVGAFVISDVIDCSVDQSHLLNKKRPFPSGKVSIKTGYFFASSFYCLSFILEITGKETILHNLIFIFVLIFLFFTFFF